MDCLIFCYLSAGGHSVCCGEKESDVDCRLRRASERTFLAGRESSGMMRQWVACRVVGVDDAPLRNRRIRRATCAWFCSCLHERLMIS